MIQLTRKQKAISLMTVGGIVLIAVVVGAFALFRSDSQSPEVTPANATNVVKFIASDNFNKLDGVKQKEFLDQMRENPEMRDAMFSQRQSLTEKERENLRRNMGNMFRQQMQDRMNRYFALKTAEEKNEMLDEMIADMEKHRAEMDKRRKEDTDKKPESQPDDGKSRESHMREHMEKSSPQERAQMHQFMSDMMARMKARGITPPGPPGGPRH